MKNFLLTAFFCLLLALSSCKKQNTDPAPGTLIATVNGADVNLSTSAVARMFYDADLKEYGLNVVGSTGTVAGSGSIVAEMLAFSPFANGTYTCCNVATSTQIVNASIIYVPASNSNTEPFFAGDGSESFPITVTITSISNTNLQGTFTGTSVSTSPAANTTISGKFNVAIEHD